jgi:type II secretory pathway component GspD/PulD (secretin)
VDTNDLTLLFEVIRTQGTIKVLSSPQITTLNNQKAIVRVVTEEVFYAAEVQPAIVTTGVATEPVVEYTPLRFPIGVVLDVTPQIGQGHVVTLNVHPTITHVVDVVESPNEDTQPVVAVRELDTVGTVSSNQTLVIAGLMSEFFDHEESGVPLLKDIPLLGYLFKRTTQKKRTIELVMLLTPTIMDEETIRERAEAAELLIKDNM